MIRPPRRAVTRFLIPLLDVLILLFCIFLLMPFVGTPGSPENATSADVPPAEQLTERVTELELQLAQAKAESERLRASQANPANRLSVRILEIDGATGQLYSFDPEGGADPRQVIADASDAQRLIDQHKRLSGGKDVFFLILYPRKRTGFPERPQREQYERWFAGVPHGFDNPWGEPPAPASQPKG